MHNQGRFSLCVAVFLLFLTLKLAEVGVVASWSWWWVTAPLWGPIALMLGISATLFALAGILGMIDAIYRKAKGIR